MSDLLDLLPFAAAAFAIPQFLPQVAQLRRTADAAGVSWSWAALTSVNNGAWLVYFALAHYWAALAPSISATVLAGVLVTMLTVRSTLHIRSGLIVLSWAMLLIAALAISGRAGLGMLLTGAFVLQVTPSIWAAYRTKQPTGIAPGTWMLIFGELSCWLSFGIHKSDPRLIILGCTGIAASILMLSRVAWTRRFTNADPRLAVTYRHKISDLAHAFGATIAPGNDAGNERTSMQEPERR